MKRIRKYLFILIVSGLVMAILAGCDKRNNREWLENKFGTELSRVYPTEDLTALFQEFPEGFKIHQAYQKKDYFIEIDLLGEKDSQAISGTLKVTDLSTAEEKEIVSIPVHYQERTLIFSDEKEARKYWPFDGFLFQHMTIDKAFLSKLNLTDKGYSFQNGDFHLNYTITNKTVNDYLQLARDKELTFRLGGSNSNRGYYYSVIFEDIDDDYYFKETISDTNN